MNTVINTRRAMLAALIVPMLAVTTLSVATFAGASDAYAQQRGGNDRPGGPDGGDDPTHGDLPPCSLTAAPSPNCRPWTPPRQVSSADECECRVTWKVVGGKKIAIKDCYVTLPTQEVMYCENDHLIRR